MKIYNNKHTCLHCEIEDIIDKHKWVDNLSPTKIKLIVLKDLINVIFDLIFYKRF